MNSKKQKKALKFATLLTIISILLQTFSSAYAYTFMYYYNGSTSYRVLPQHSSTYYYISSNCPSDAITPIVSAMSTWNSATPTGLTLNLYSSSNSSYSYSASADALNTIGTPISSSQMSQIASSNTIACNHLFGQISGSYWYITESDIVINNSFSFSTGSLYSYYDYQGIFTHELGHSYGLNDCGYSGAISDIPTMYGAGTYTYNGTTYYNAPFYYRSLTDDDKWGKLFIGFELGY